MSERLGIAGSGAIATGLAAAASVVGDVVLVARSDASSDRARATIEKLAGRSSARWFAFRNRETNRSISA